MKDIKPTSASPGGKDFKKTQMNFERGVNYKVTPDAATCADAERGEATNKPGNFNWTHEPFTEELTPYPDKTRQMNFPNGSGS